MSKSRAPDSPSRVLSASYIEKHSSKNDLVRRLRTVVDALGDDDIEPNNSQDYPGLASLASALVGDRFLSHRDKEVRLHTVLACMEIFYLYAPDPPWYESEILKVFSQMIRQLANLAHCTSPSQANFNHYFRLLEQLSEVRIGVVLVELTRSLDSDVEDGDDTPSREEALETLADLVRTILRCVHIDHPPEVKSHAVSAVSACIDEFDGTVPICVLDEILTCIGEGPVVYVTNPAAVEAAAKAAKKKEKPEKMPPMQIQQTNPSYHAASAVIRRTVDRISTPIAGLLNGLLNGDNNVITQTVISSAEAAPAAASSAFPVPEKQAGADVWAIVYELHRISPPILTTVIGTVTSSLESPDVDLRLRVTKLLGRLFYAPSSKIAIEFNPCFRKWLGRSNDKEPKIRHAMVKYLVAVLSNKGQEKTLVTDASDTIIDIIEHDPTLEVRLEAIHTVCDLAFKSKGRSDRDTDSHAWVSSRLLRAVGNRVCSKNKTEHRDAITGLAQIYFRHYIEEKLRQVQSGGDDCDIHIILDVLHGAGCIDDAHTPSNRKSKKRRSLADDEDDPSDLETRFAWIPKLVFESASYTDATDPDMRSRVVQIVDDVLLGSTSKDEKSKKGSLTATSRAVGLALIVSSLRDDGEDIKNTTSNACKWMRALLVNRSSLQRAVAQYIDARSKIRQCEPDTEEGLTAEAEAMECLEAVAKLTAPISGSGSSATDLQTVLQKLHSARDTHIFRILATIANPTHSASARARALDELPKRTKPLGTATVEWVKRLARRCAMGNFINVENIHHSILLAQECLHEGDLRGCMSFLVCVKMAVNAFPTLCGTKEAFGTLVELFGECRSPHSGSTKKDIEDSGVVTVLSEILAAAAPARAARFAGDKDKGITAGLIDIDIQTKLANLCTRDGTPQQAKFAVFTMAALQRPTGSSSHDGEREIEAFSSLLKSLTSPTRLSLTSGGGGAGNVKLVSILTALAALAESAPGMFNESNARGQKAIRFALETILLGRSDSSEDIESDEDADRTDEEEDVATPASTKSRRRNSNGRSNEGVTQHSTPGDSIDVLEDASLSVACRTACAAIEFLVSHIRSTVSKAIMARRGTAKAPQQEHIQSVFSILLQILRDNGLPPSNRDRRSCRSRQDRAALRQCAAVHTLLLCDARLKLEKKYLTPGMWHVFSRSLVDEERAVRSAVMDQLSQMLRGNHAPSLRFLALLCLCVDGEHGGHSSANGNAAHVGKRAVSTKDAGLQFISYLRKTCDTYLAQCRARGREAEMKFESHVKMMLMPEFSVPFALHLLSFRRETPSAGGSSGTGMTQASNAENEEVEMTSDEQGRHRMLKKRLRWLFEPLVQSLGDGADNISFLLRMTEIIGKNYCPTVVSEDLENAGLSQEDDNGGTPLSVPSEESHINDKESLAAAKLKVICGTAREVLLSFVKKDVNLTPYPGAVQVPSNLFKRRTCTASLSQSSDVSLPGSPSHSSTRTASQQSQPESQTASFDETAQVTSPRVSSQRMRKSLRRRDHGDASDGEGSAISRARRTRARESVDSSTSALSASQRRGRVHFSPEVQFGSNSFGAEDDAGQSDDEDEASSPVRTYTPQSRDAFENLSPIQSPNSASPSPGTSKDSNSERLTLGTTPPSILRSPDPHPTPQSLDSAVDEKKPRNSRGRRSRKAFAAEGKENLSTTPNSSNSLNEKRKSPGSSTKGSSAKKRRSSKPVQIKVGRSDTLAKKTTRQATKRTSKRKRKAPSQREASEEGEIDEFDFPDDDGDMEDEWEQSEAKATKSRLGRGNNAGRGATSSRTTRMKSPKEVSLGSVSSPDSSESSSITNLKRRSRSGRFATKSKPVATARTRSRRNTDRG